MTTVIEKAKKVFGIDLGTTYSCVAEIDSNGMPSVKINSDGRATTPSVVYYQEAKKVVVGREAKNQALLFPDKVVSAIKREMSKTECFKKPTKHPYGYDPAEISSDILRALVAEANEGRAEEDIIKDVVITCPADFGTSAKENTRQAGVLAGLNVIDILQEPVAAAIYYATVNKKLISGQQKYVLVYDLGGGTFDVSILRLQDHSIEVIVTGGQEELGGKDWDELLAKNILKSFNKQLNKNYSFEDKKVYYTFMEQAEEIKFSLSKTHSKNDNVTRAVGYDGFSITYTINREYFDGLTAGESGPLETTISLTKQLIDKAKDKIGNALVIDEYLLVGGSCYMPQVKEAVDKTFDCDAKLSDPNQCVAKGAAIYAYNRNAWDMWNDVGKLPGAGPAPLPGPGIRTVSSKTYGLEIVGNLVSNLIYANMDLPAHEEDIFTTSKDNMHVGLIAVYESNASEKDGKISKTIAKKVSDYNYLIKGDYPQGVPQIKVSFDMGTNGILKVHISMDCEEDLEFECKVDGVRNYEELVSDTEYRSDMIATTY